MIKIGHIAIWCQDLEKMKSFYERYFGAVASEKYENKAKQFQSYFLTLGGGECRLELMQKAGISEFEKEYEVQHFGIIHFAVSVGSRAKVDELTAQLAAAGYSVVGQPRTTGDGCYESVVLDCEQNILEITE